MRQIKLTFRFAGPINNFGNNVKEVARVFACTTTLTYNLTRTRFDLMTKPFQSALLSMTENITRFEENIKSIDAVIAPILDEIEGVEDDKKFKRSSK
jgi:E3 ubiquitin-protein ligase DCST1